LKGDRDKNKEEEEEKKNKRIEEYRVVIRDSTSITGLNGKFSVVQAPKLYPFVLLVKVLRMLKTG
jgi:hypothetical protein